MRTLLGMGAVVLGVAGVLLCAAAIGIGWWTAVKTAARLDRAVARLDHGLSEVDLRLSRVEARMNAARSVLDGARETAEAIAAADPERPRVRAGIERVLERFVPAFDRADALADSLRAVAAGLVTGADVVDQLKDDSQATVRVREAADKIDRAAEALNGLRTRIEALKVAQAIDLTRELVALAREAIASSERLAEGLAAARQEIGGLREGTAAWRDEVVTWIHLAAIANSVVWLWGGLGQLCLIGWGRRRQGARAAAG